MLQKLIPYLIIVSVFVGCSDKPKNLIPKNKMANILIDARFISSATVINRTSMEAYGANLDTYIYDKYGIDSLQFVESSNYYAKNVKDYEEIFNRVVDSLEKLKTALKALEEKETKEKEKREKDSIASLKAKDSLQNPSRLKDSLLEPSSNGKLKRQVNKEEPSVLITPVSSKN